MKAATKDFILLRVHYYKKYYMKEGLCGVKTFDSIIIRT